MIRLKTYYKVFTIIVCSIIEKVITNLSTRKEEKKEKCFDFANFALFFFGLLAVLSVIKTLIIFLKKKQRGKKRNVGAKPKVFSLIPLRSCVFSDLTFTSCVDIAQILFHADALSSYSVPFFRHLLFLCFPPLILTRISLEVQRWNLIEELVFFSVDENR